MKGLLRPNQWMLRRLPGLIPSKSCVTKICRRRTFAWKRPAQTEQSSHSVGVTRLEQSIKVSGAQPPCHAQFWYINGSPICIGRHQLSSSQPSNAQTAPDAAAATTTPTTTTRTTDSARQTPSAQHTTKRHREESAGASLLSTTRSKPIIIDRGTE